MAQSVAQQVSTQPQVLRTFEVPLPSGHLQKPQAAQASVQETPQQEDCARRPEAPIQVDFLRAWTLP